MKKTTFFPRFSSVFGVVTTIPITVTSLLLMFVFLAQNIQAQNQNCQLNCISAPPGQHAIQVSVDTACEAYIYPEDYIVGEDLTCPGGVFNALIHTVGDPLDTIAFGNPAIIPSGTPLEVIYTLVIQDSVTGQSCWSSILLEDKLPPQITCGDTTMSCIALGTFLPVATDNCDPNPVVELVNTLPDSCGQGGISIVRNVYQSRDHNGAVSPPCTLTINVLPLPLDSIQYPADTNLLCDSGYATTDLGGVPGAPHPSVSGEPTAGGIGLYSNPQSQCNIIVDFTDRDIPFQGCSNGVMQKILRTWTVTRWDCDGADTTVTMVQKIEIEDDKGPEITCPADFSVAAGTQTCEALVNLPAALATDNCNSQISYTTLTPVGLLNSNGGSVLLPVGTHTITYQADDACGNRSTCEMSVTVSDMSPPEPVCDAHTIVSLTSTGTATVLATTFDDGSHDNCSNVYFKVRRMNIGECSQLNGDDNPTTGIYDEWFDDSAQFCCEDISNSPIMVILRVYDVDPGPGPVSPNRHNTDLLGRWNECMVEVTVQDKLPPVVSCPPNITVSCEFDYNSDDLAATFGTVVPAGTTRDSIIIVDPAWNGNSNPRFWGLDGEGRDNCNVVVEELPKVENLNSCGFGTIRRSWRVTDDGGRTAFCNQTITIVNTTPFSPLPDAFPPSITLSECNLSNLTPDVTGDVNISNDNECSLVAVDYEDQLFEIVPGACFKILRTWTIIDWCQYDGNGEGIWTQGQIIKVINTERPTFTSACTSPPPVESNDPNCAGAFVTLTETGEDDCTPSEDIVYGYAIDLNNDGSYDITGDTNDASGEYPVGVHKIRWTIEDKCGNKESCSYTFEVQSKTKPILYCRDVITVVDDNGQAEIWASDVDLGSSHPCGNPISLSFTTNPADSFITFTCDDLGDNLVRLYAIDHLGNFDYCELNVIIQDNERDVCPNGVPQIRIRGEVMTEHEVPVSGTEMNLEGSGMDPVLTGQDGEYVFEGMDAGGDYVLRPHNNDNARESVGTLDLIYIQRHILGIREFDSPYQYIAADADNSQAINVLDLLAIQRVILGLSSEFPNNTSWRFVDRDYVFTDEDPLTQPYAQDYSIEGLNAHMRINFVGIKVGDVNNSFTPRFAGNIAPRKSFELEVENELFVPNHPIRIDLKSIQGTVLTGVQFKFSYDPALAVFKGIESDRFDISPMHYHDERGVVTVSWYNAEGAPIQPDDIAMTLLFESKTAIRADQLFRLLDDGLHAEVYDIDAEPMALDVRIRALAQTQDAYVLYQNRPNPFRDETVVRFDVPKSGMLQLRLMDLSGKTVFERDIQAVKGYNEVRLSKSDINGSGILYYQLSNSEFVATKRMVIID